MNESFAEKPRTRKLQGYAFDPSLSLLIETAAINKIIYTVPWEEPKKSPTSVNSTATEPLQPGPVGEYLEIIDYDPTVKKYYAPVDLNDPYLLANDGFDPSESNPMFHQQMVYAVAMTTIQNFEQALGRKIIWAPMLLADGKKYEEYVARLRIYPHAFRDANAYYSPVKKSILFGYFPANPRNSAVAMPGSIVFTCLSHDIIAHEMTHAILDGLHRNYLHPTNPDVLAFHEAFADIVALFQHFTFPSVLKHQIARTKGDLGKQNLLGELAVQFGTAIGRYGSLRSAIGQFVDGKWESIKPSTDDYVTTLEAHDRGSILVAAVFEAFLSIYRSKVSDLLRIATNGSGILPEGNIHPDLVNRLALEAAKSAKHVLTMCVRAIDYCPPVDINFGDYLRALVTADYDIVTDDNQYYRLAFIDAFRRRGIYPENIRTLSEDSLRYRLGDKVLDPTTKSLIRVLTDYLRKYRNKVINVTDRYKIYDISRNFIRGEEDDEGLHQSLRKQFITPEFEKLTGLIFNADFLNTIPGYTNELRPSFQILNLRVVARVGPNGNVTNQIIFNLIQRIGLVIKKDGRKQHQVVQYFKPGLQPPPDDGVEVMGGSTLIFDLDTLTLQYAIAKPLLNPDSLDNGVRELNMKRILQQITYQTTVLPQHMSDFGLYFQDVMNSQTGEPFGFLHH